MNVVLFVCSGNTCRSPLALAAWQALERENSLPGWMAQTAGTMASSGAPASRHAQSIAHNWDVDLSAHKSQLLIEEIAKNASRIITMTQTQAELIRAEFPEAEVEVLGSYLESKASSDLKNPSLEALLQNIESGGESRDIPDPFGGSFDDYQVCALKIKDAVAALRESLRAESM